MYKCKECGAEYEVKPDYCDCGNDEFEGINVSEEVNKKTAAEDENTRLNPSQSNENTSSAATNNTPKPQPAEAKTFSAAKESSYIPKRELNIDPISLSIFGFCLLLSLYIIFFAWNGVNQDNNQIDIKQQTDVAAKNIPSVDKIWNNALPVIKIEPAKQEKIKPIETVENIVKPIISVTKPAAQTQKTAAPQKTVLPKTTMNTQKKTTTVTLNKTTANTQKTVDNTKVQQNAEDAAKLKAEAERKKAEAEQLKKLQAVQAKKAAEEKARQAQIAKQEYEVYKANLRNNLARRIDFTRVIGDGSCTVAFKIDSAGKMINRSFAKQSSNNTLNDAVYNAIMSMPAFNPPPSGYKNEVLNLSIKFYNGNFEISLK